VKSPYKKEMANWMVNNYQVSVQRACRCVRLPKSMYYYLHHRRDEGLLKMRINEIAQTHVRYSFERIFVLLRSEGFLARQIRITLPRFLRCLTAALFPHPHLLLK